MPLSKVKDKERKRKERTKSRLDKLLCQPQFAMRLRERKVKPIRYCEACGYSETVDVHHEGEQREEHTLCPNCHGLITRHIRTLEQLLPSQTLNPVQPKHKMYMAGVEIHIDIDADGNPIPDIT